MDINLVAYIFHVVTQPPSILVCYFHFRPILSSWRFGGFHDCKLLLLTYQNYRTKLLQKTEESFSLASHIHFDVYPLADHPKTC